MKSVKGETRNVTRWGFVLCSMLMAVAIPVLGIGKLRRALRYVSLGMMAMRAFRSWRG